MEPHRITRALLVTEVPGNTKGSKKEKVQKKVKFEGAMDDGERNPESQNSSFIADEEANASFFFSPSPTLDLILKPKHPLNDSWTLWYSAGDRRLSWKKNQKKIAVVTTVEEFWFTYHQVQLVSSLPPGFTYSVFRTGILPDREDLGNKDGGRWIASFQEEDERKEIDEKWMKVLEMILGEEKDGGVCKFLAGAEACARKKSDKLELWVKNMNRMEAVVKLGRMFKDRVKAGDGDSSSIHLSIHSEDIEGGKGLKLMM